jgi:formate dehydrogenase major subunit
MAGAVGLREVRYGYAGDNHLALAKDESNPYFTFDASKCIVCSRCVRACEEVQGTFALTIQGSGFRSKVSAGIDEGFLNSECVSCGACVQACPTATLSEKSVIEMGTPERAVETTCAYWCRPRAARPTTATPASKAASRGATPPARNAC